MKSINVFIKKLHEDVEIPKYATDGSSGFDLVVHHFKTLYNAQKNPVDKDGTFVEVPDEPSRHENAYGQIILTPHSRLLVGCGYSVEIPDGFEMQVRPRSGLALKQGLTVANSPGTVDSDYRGEIGVILINTSKFELYISKGDRVAQGVIVPVWQAKFNETTELSETNRGAGGYGSSGIR